MASCDSGNDEINCTDAPVEKMFFFVDNDGVVPLVPQVELE